MLAAHTLCLAQLQYWCCTLELQPCFCTLQSLAPACPPLPTRNLFFLKANIVTQQPPAPVEVPPELKNGIENQGYLLYLPHMKGNSVIELLIFISVSSLFKHQAIPQQMALAFIFIFKWHDTASQYCRVLLCRNSSFLLGKHYSSKDGYIYTKLFPNAKITSEFEWHGVRFKVIRRYCLWQQLIQVD